ncbi:phenylalanine--tRNA ligase beta subunit-related protein [Trebonia sp.]|uniref:B3/B4 domain-containing protein n=1 Tax=Trebonia sp. TaxID=2767075 RepID=UPI0026280FA4|nr:phenylalanine--tRNA ligase beta subunit-related protein [Trebonia sp.]
MTQLRVSDGVCAAFASFRIAAIVAGGFAGRGPWPEVDAALAALEESAAAGQAPAVAAADPHIAAWHAAYRAFGTNPKRERPSVDALRRRLARTGRLPRISAAVDCYNLVSVTHGVPAGAFDLDAVTGDITVRFAAGDEDFTPLGEPGVTEHPRPGEVIYTDAKSVLTRHWNHRDADRTKVTADSTRVVFLLETTDAPNFGQAVAAAATDLATRLAARSARVSTHWLTPATPAALL